MKNRLEAMLIVAVLAAAVLLCVAAASVTKYVGTFVGLGSGLTNASGQVFIGAPLTNGFAFNDVSTFPTSTVPVGSASATNVWLGNYKGKLGIYATNRAVGGWMVQTNDAAGDAVWGPFTP